MPVPPSAPIASPGLPEVAPDPGVLSANLAAIARRAPEMARAIAGAAARTDMVFSRAPDGAVTATMGGRMVASQRGPVEEARRIADTVDLETSGGILILGFGVGHHVAELARRARTASALVIYEPDLGLLRAVLERVDHSEWMADTVWALATEAEDGVALSIALKGMEAALAVGVAMVEHAPSRARLGEGSARFAATFTRTFAAMRTHIITTMMQTDVTVRNESMNVAHYLRRPGIDALAGLCAGRPAIVVSAGPSLRRNVALLRDPRVRERCVIIAVQTVLKHLLAQGIRPHFVTAIDYHEISRRFYEGLVKEDVEGVTLVAEARANAAILDTFPGDIRVPGDEYLDAVLGREPEVRARLSPGATVAHQAYYLARYLGADPVMLIGQDLAFTDGQYYAPRAAIHDTWGPELNPFCSLEKLEWERIARSRGTLIEAKDHLGRRVYTDEQMATYLAQFERDFALDSANGLVTIDATEGGVRKQHAVAMPLAEALERFAHDAVQPLPPIPAAPAEGVGSEVEHGARERIRTVARDVRRIARGSTETMDLLRKLVGALDDRSRANRLIDRINAIRDEVQGLDPAFGLVMRLNQTGAFKRFKADRLIRLAQSLSPQDVQRRQVERDTVNVQWIRDMADLLADLLEEAERTFDGGPKRTHDSAPPPLGEAAIAVGARVTTGALVLAPDGDEAEREFLGTPMLARTLERVGRSAAIDSIVVVAADPHRIERIVHRARVSKPVSVVGASMDADRLAAVRAARAWSDRCWRGGIAGMTVFDEVFEPVITARIIAERGWDGAVVVGAAWCLVDPALIDTLIARFAESPEANGFTFCQAPPGVAPCVVSRAFAEDLSQVAGTHPLYATAAAALGYIALRPRSDPIAKPGCVQIDPEVRSTTARCIPDTPAAHEELSLALHGADPSTLDASALCGSVRKAREGSGAPVPRVITLEITTARAWRRFPGIDPEARWDRGALSIADAERLIGSLGRAFPGASVTLGGFGDPLLHPRWPAIVELIRASGLGPVHVRTSLAGDVHHAEHLVRGAVQAVSVDLLAHQAATYARLTGIDAYGEVIARVDAMLGARCPGWRNPWIIPRITRCDAVYDEIEVFYDKWSILTGSAMIDALRRPIPGDRIEPLARPRFVVEAEARAHLCIRADLTVPVDASDPTSTSVCGMAPDDAEGAWWALWDARRGAMSAGRWDDPILRIDS